MRQKSECCVPKYVNTWYVIQTDRPHRVRLEMLTSIGGDVGPESTARARGNAGKGGTYIAYSRSSIPKLQRQSKSSLEFVCVPHRHHGHRPGGA